MRSRDMAGWFCGWIACLIGLNAATGHASAADYMIGLKAEIASKADLKRHGVPDAAALIVLDVLRNGPAEAAGIGPGDLLIGLANRPLNEVRPLTELRQLHEAVQASGGEALEIELVRDGKARMVRLKPVKRDDGELLSREAERLTNQDNGLGGLLKNFSPADLLDLGGLDIEVRRRGQADSRTNAELERQLERSRDPIAIYGRINVGQLLGGLWSGSSSSSSELETERLQRRVDELEQQIEQLKARLDALSDPAPQPNGS